MRKKMEIDNNGKKGKQAIMQKKVKRKQYKKWGKQTKKPKKKGKQTRKQKKKDHNEMKKIRKYTVLE